MSVVESAATAASKTPAERPAKSRIDVGDRVKAPSR